MKTQNFWRVTTLILVVVLLFGCVGVAGLAGGVMLAPQLQGAFLSGESASAATVVTAPTPPPSEPLNITINADEEEQLLANIYRQASPSVVHIRVVQHVTAVVPGTPEFPGFPPVPGFPHEEDFYQRGEASGFVLDKEGHIVTNYHVAGDADKVEVTFFDGTTVRAKVIGGDPDADLAVLQVDVDPDILHPVKLADSDKLFVGQRAIAIGNPFGQEWTMTSGIISALGRTLPSGTSQYSIPEMIQTDAAINPGNSGGPLLNAQGEVIGVNTMIISRSRSSAGVGFAVPSNIVKQIVPVLIEKGEYVYPWLGLQGVDLSLDLIEAMDLPTGTQGALVVKVAEGGPADKAGLRGSDSTVKVEGLELPVGGDVIIAINDRPVTGMDDLIAYLVKETRPGDKVTLTILRDGKERTVTVELGERPHATER